MISEIEKCKQFFLHSLYEFLRWADYDFALQDAIPIRHGVTPPAHPAPSGCWHFGSNLIARRYTAQLVAADAVKGCCPF